MKKFVRKSLLLFGVSLALVTTACGSSEESASIETGNESWPYFGRVLQRTHYLPAPDELNPPLKQEWSFSDRALIEFPPALNDGIAYLADKYGNVRALRLSDQKVLWDLQKDKREVGPPSDTTAPAYFEGHVFVAFQGGQLVSLDSTSGKVDWRRKIVGGLQSSPIVADGRLFVGSEAGTLYALDADSGRTEWAFDADTPIKASPSVDGNRVFAADYAGQMFSLDATDGKLAWSTDTTKTSPGGDGGFYSSPAVAGGKVFAGRDDGTVYAFDRNTGKQSWSFETSGPIYGSPAVAEVPGTPLTVYIGSYDSRLYALDAASGKKLWDYDVGGPVPGTATVIGHTVYTSSFKTVESVGIDVLSHRKTFSFDSPGYTPMISDGRNLFLIGYFTVHGFRPG